MLLREEALVAKDNRIIHLEDMDVKNRILERYDEYRRNNRRWTVRYNNDTERWRRMSNGCIRQAQHLKGQFRASQIHINNLQQIFVLQNPNMATIQDITITLAPHLAAM
ncbi:hypothetical protein RhiirA1_448684 [Rhizophagus irregularis]|uniref:Uncharacterized protein n=1 Tax=Rhizophagus irregularis TaxID=588596 RepID=A0A2N0SIX4_9GLOM|nr:hypothetical protein RhiirA1_448684 [Rhizophagus irregularis]